MTTEEMKAYMQKHVDDFGCFFYAQVMKQALEYMEKLEAELTVIPPGGVHSKCILFGCHNMGGRSQAWKDFIRKVIPGRHDD